MSTWSYWFRPPDGLDALPAFRRQLSLCTSLVFLTPGAHVRQTASQRTLTLDT